MMADSPHLEELKAWTKGQGLTVRASGSNDQRDPGFVVAITNGGVFGNAELVRGDSLDSMDTAAMYVLHKLRALGIDV
jgi:hypothetical protein